VASIRSDLRIEQFATDIPMYKLSDGLETFYRLHMDALDLNVYKALTQNMILTKLRDFPQQSFPLHAVLLTVSFLMAALLEACDSQRGW